MNDTFAAGDRGKGRNALCTGAPSPKMNSSPIIASVRFRYLLYSDALILPAGVNGEREFLSPLERAQRKVTGARDVPECWKLAESMSKTRG